MGKKRKKDIAESDFSHQNESRKVYLAYARSHKSTLKITCFQKGILLSPERIHKIIWEKVKPLL